MADTSRLIQMHIKNLGCVGNDGLTIQLDDIVCLVGANNTGKSTVLRAYEAAVSQLALAPEDFNNQAGGQPATVELWVHIPQAAGNVDQKWKEQRDGLLLVRSRWTWPLTGGKPVRTTWDPSSNDYAEDGKASGLDTVFNSRLPKPFRIGSLEDPEEEHKKLLTLVLEPVVSKLKALMDDKDSPITTKIAELRAEAEKPVAEFKEDLARVESQVNSSYRRVFSAAAIKLTVSLGELGIDPSKSLASASRVDIAESHGLTRWNQQGTGSQRALFWSMLQVRSELNRLAEERKQRDKAIKDKEKEIEKQEKKLPTLKKDDKKQECEAEIARLKIELEGLRTRPNDTTGDSSDPFLPGYMLLIDEPETALHPAAVRAAKEHLYALAAESGWQVMLSTHHPAFVDPLKDHTTIVRLHRPELHFPPNTYRSREVSFSGDEIENLKTLLTFDTTVAEMFFGSRVIIVEGDTEYAAFAELMSSDVTAFPYDSRPLIIRARGKATIRLIVRMLTHFKLDFAVLHDIDSPKTASGDRANSAYTENTRITEAIDSGRNAGVKIVHRCSCPNFELHHNMLLPDKDKPYESWKSVRDSDAIRASVRAVFDTLVTPMAPDPSNDTNDGQHFDATLRSWAATNAAGNPAYTFDS